MNNYIIRYKVVETHINEGYNISYTSTVHIVSDTLENAQQKVIDSYVDTPEIAYVITIK